MDLMMTPERIKSLIGLDVDVQKSDTDEYFWLRYTAHGQTKSERVMMDATEDDLRRLRDRLDAWADEEQG
jgi:hypothetical protein